VVVLMGYTAVSLTMNVYAVVELPAWLAEAGMGSWGRAAILSRRADLGMISAVDRRAHSRGLVAALTIALGSGANVDPDQYLAARRLARRWSSLPQHNMPDFPLIG
jgi:hypothetical protein